MLVAAASTEDRAVHFTDLDGLRGVLALAIVLFHYGANSLVLRATHGVLPGFALQLAVDFFFVLSGFVLAHSARHGVRPMEFARRRAWRLLPVYFATLAAVVLIGLLARTDAPYLTRSPSLSRILADVPLAYPIVAPQPLNVPAWSITWELYLPIAAVALATLLPVNRLWRPLLVAALLAASVLTWRAAMGENWYAARAAAELLLGAMLYRWRPQVPPRLLFPLLAAMAGVLALAMRLPVLALAFPSLAAAVVLAGTMTTTALSSRPAAFLGRISYTLYMVHVPVLACASLIAPNLSGSVPIKGVALLASVGIAALLSATIERWGMRRGYRPTR